jgi:multidrug efflux pump subunit AcrB
LVRIEPALVDTSIYHKNLMPVTYVTADIAGAMESPVYAILKLGPEMDKFKAPEGYAIEQHMAALPADSEHYSMKWDGEWQITYEVFRDLGIAFAAVLILIYALGAGFFVTLRVALGYYVNPAWFLFTAFVGLNLFQLALTNWCPMLTILRKLGV